MKLLDKILEYLGIRDKYERLVEPQIVYDLDGAILETDDVKDRYLEDMHRTHTYEGQTLRGMQIGGYGNTRSNKNSEARAFEQRIRQGIDLSDIHRRQAETGRKYTIINDEHYNNRQEHANININGNAKIIDSDMDLDKISINDAELINVRAYRSSEQDQSMDL